MDLRCARRVLPVALLAPLAACATLGGLRQEPLGAGSSETFEGPLGRVVDAARQALLEAGFALRGDSGPAPGTWMLLGEKGLSLFSNGELVRIVAREDPPDHTTAYVVTQRRTATNFLAREDWSPQIFERMARTLATAPGLGAEGRVTLASGARVRLTWRTQDPRMEGELRAKRGDTLVVVDAAVSRVVTPLIGELRALEFLRSRRTSTTTGALIGMVVGAAAGAGIAAGTTQDRNALVWDPMKEPLMIVFLGAGTGVLVGGLVGSTIATERWEPVPLDRLTVVLAGPSAGAPRR